MVKFIFLFCFLLVELSFSQIPSTESSFLDSINLIIEPEYQIYKDHWNHKVLDGKPYIQKPVNGNLDFNFGHTVGIGVGLRGFGWKILFSLKLNYMKNSPVSFFKLKNGNTVGKEVQSNFINEDFYVQYYFNNHVGLGLNYKNNTEEYTPSNNEDYPSLLNITLNYKMIYLYFPYKYRYKINNMIFVGKIGFSVFSKNSSMNYFAAFMNFQDPDNPDIPSTAGHATINIKNSPKSVFFNFGFVFFSKIKLLYHFEYDWCKSYYTKYENSLILKFTIPSFE